MPRFFLNGIGEMGMGYAQLFGNLADFHKISCLSGDYGGDMFVQKTKIVFGNLFASF